MNSHRFPGSQRKIFIKITLFFISFCLSLLLGEGALRFMGYQSRFVKQDRIKSPVKIKNPYPDVPYLLKPGSSFIHKNIFYRVNNAGFRGPDFSFVRNKKVRIAFLGDSFCFGPGVPEAEHFIHLLEQKLSTSPLFNGQFELYSFGVQAFNTVHEVALFEHVVLDYQPDVCIIWYFLNDGTNERTLNFLAGKPLLKKYRRQSRLLDIFVAPIDSYLGTRRLITHYQQCYQSESKAIKVVHNALHKFSQLCRQNHIRPMLAIHPILFELNETYPFQVAHQQVLNLAAEAGIPGCDLFPHFRGMQASELWLSRTDQHPNPKAHKIVATGFYKDLITFIEEEKEYISQNREYHHQRLPIIQH